MYVSVLHLTPIIDRETNCVLVVVSTIVFDIHSAQRYCKGHVLYTFGMWTTVIFVGAADCEISC